jgi:hypothetical protein
VVGEPGGRHLFELDKVRAHFGFSFESEPHLSEHIGYWLSQAAQPDRSSN